MKTQNSAKITKPIEYDMNIWDSSLSKVPKYTDMDITLSKKSGSYNKGGTYSRNATERQYIWIFSSPNYNIQSTVT